MDMMREKLFLNPQIDFGHGLALTPITEMNNLKDTFSKILEFKESKLKEHFNELEKIADPKLIGFINKIKEAELSLHSGLKLEKERFRL